jgi:general stress protein CsbA
MLEVVVAVLLPILLMLLFVRVTYNLFVSLGLSTVVLIIMLKGYEQTIWVQAAGLVGLAAGYLIAKKPYKKVKKKLK